MADELTPKFITDSVTECEKRTKDLRQRMDDDFDLLALKEFEIDKAQGEYESYTSNSPSVLSNKVTEMLATADLNFTIPLLKETEPEREKVSHTERFAYGSVAKADEWVLLNPHNPPTQAQMAWYATNRGWIALRFVMRKDKDDIIPDLAVWDMRNVYWGLGKRGTKWACYCRSASADQLKGEYGKKFQPDKFGRVIVYDWWDEKVEAVMIGDEFVEEPEEHGLEKPPILILPVGSMPLIQSSKRDDTAKFMGESVFVNNRGLYPKNNELLSYYFTAVATGTRTPTVVYYKGPKPPEFAANPYIKGRTIFLSVDKAERVEEFYKPTMPAEAAAAVAWVRGELSMGGLSPIMHGEINQQMPAAGMALLTHAGMTIIQPRIDAMARAYTWLANEMVRQYKHNEKFEDLELEGFDSAKRQFVIKVNKDNLIDNRKILATLKPKMPQDDLQNAGIATQLFEAGLLSPESAQDKYLGVADTDLENEKIDRGTLRRHPRILMRRMLAAAINDKDYLAANVLMDELEDMQRGERGNGQGMPEEKGVAPMAGVSRGMIPSSLVRGGQEMEVPTEIRERMMETARLRNIGMERGT